MCTPATDLPNDILNLIFQVLQDDYNSLFRCALVNQAFNQAASKFLYRRVVLAPHFRAVLSLGESPVIPLTSNLVSASLPKNAGFVEVFEIAGFLPTQPFVNQTLLASILTGLDVFKNLRVAILTPVTSHREIFAQVIQHLVTSGPQTTSETALYSSLPGHDIRNLQELEVNTSCTDEHNAPVLSHITGLSKLSIHSPTRAILDLLPDWLRRLSGSLTELHLKDNCGSVTPGVLKSFVPSMQRNIRAVSLGLSYSLTDEDVFGFLKQLNGLHRVELRYYWQLKSPISRPNLGHLESFTACHANFQTRSEVRSLCKWIRRAISPSPIQALHIIQDEPTDDYEDDDGIPSNTGANVSFRSIIDHLCSLHSETLCILNMKNAYIDVRSLRKLFTTCRGLEEVYLCAGSHALTIFKKHAISLSKLHTASFNIRNIRLSKQRAIDMELVTAIMKHGPPLLRRLSVNGQTWESTFKRVNDGSFALVVYKQPRLFYPWDREPKSSLEHHQQPAPTESVLKSRPPDIAFLSSTVGSSTVQTAILGGQREGSGATDTGSSSNHRLHVRFSELD